MLSFLFNAFLFCFFHIHRFAHGLSYILLVAWGWCVWLALAGNEVYVCSAFIRTWKKHLRPAGTLQRGWDFC
jgi:hypothetical protein